MLVVQNQRQQGFTLIEVMIALVIVSISLAALSRSMGVTVLNQAQLESRIIATWVAEDELLKQHVLSGKESNKGKLAEVVKQFDREWKIELRSESTEFQGIKKSVMTVTDQNDQSSSVRLVTVVGE